MQQKFTPQEATASSSPLEREEEAWRRFGELSVAFYLLVDTGRPERLEAVGRMMDEQASEARRLA